LNKRKDQVFVWPIYTRVIHWLIAFSFILSFIFSLKENLLNFHSAVGITFGLMLIYRIIWGFIGPRYATFNTFELSPAKLKFYFEEKLQNRWRQIPAGHNPASSWFTLIVIGLGSIISLTGLLLYGIQEGKGYFRFLNENYYMYMDVLFDIHMYVSYFLLVWVIIHITGVLVEHFYHKTSMLLTMITGYKKTQGIDSKPARYKRCFSFIFLIISAIIFYFSIDTSDNAFTASLYTPIDYKQESPVYANKCGTCHKLYPPFMLPTSSWNRIQEGLENHFGRKISPTMDKDDNRISLSEQKNIFAYLTEHSADKSTREISFKVMKSLDGTRGRLSITKIKYWKDVHSNISRHIFKSKEVKRKANCFACHKNFDKGLIEDIEIVTKK
jgi:cytochrome b